LIHNNTFSNLVDANIAVYGVCGVVWSNTFYTPVQVNPIESQATTWGGGVNGDVSWASPSLFGTSNFMFYETNTFINTSNNPDIVCLDSIGAGRWVFRYNTLSNFFIQNHGTESGYPNRGCRASEVYCNTVTNSQNTADWYNMRAGTAIIFSNVIHNIGGGKINAFTELKVQRSTYNYPGWSAANGTNSLDQNLTNGGGPVFSFAAASAGPLTVSDPNAAWTPNQWQGLVIVDSSQNFPTNFSLITSNNANQIIYQSTSKPGGGASLEINVGDLVTGWCPSNAIDMPGMGQCTGLLFTPDGSTITNTAGPLNQQIEPIYSWSNTMNGVDVGIVNTDPIPKPGVHYFNDTPKPGYAPFTFPHPLTLLVRRPLPPTPPLPPTDLRIVSSR
jgi:hypothetical protein